MNEIIVRLNAESYKGGDIIYGAVFLRVVTPVYGDTVNIAFLGKEDVSWTQTNFASSAEENMKSKTKTLTLDKKSNHNEIIAYEQKYVGTKSLLEVESNLYHFDVGAVPVGQYAFPFQLSLQQGLPSSFRRAVYYNKAKDINCSSSIEYRVIASVCHGTNAKLFCEQNIMIEYDKSLRKIPDLEIPVRNTKKLVQHCCCLGNGEISVAVKLDKWKYKLGEKIDLHFDIDNESSKLLTSATFKLTRIMCLEGTPEGEPKGKKQLRFCENVHIQKVSFSLPNGQFAKHIFIPLDCPGDDQISSTHGSHVMCQFLVEMELLVPQDIDILIDIPIVVDNTFNDKWLHWDPPDWISHAVIKDVQGIMSVPRRTYVSKEFSYIHLPCNVGTL